MVYQQISTHELKGLRGLGQMREQAKTPNLYFQKLFPAQTAQYGPAFLELRESDGNGFKHITPISINIELFASILSDPSLGLSVVYYEPDMQFYYMEPMLNIYKPTAPEKLQSLYRGLLIRCAHEMNNDVNMFNLFHEFRSDKTAKAVVQRAKSILAADHTFFGPESRHQRQKGPEMYERLARVFVESMLEPKEGACLTVTQAYNIFCKLALQRNLGQLKRSTFKEMMRDFIKDKYGMSLRHDVPDSENRHQQAWKGLKVVEAGVGVAG